MPPQPATRLQEVDHRRIRAYLKQDAVLQVIATETGYTAHQVRNFLRRLNASSKKGGVAKQYPPQVPISHEQYLLIERCKRTKISLPDLAKRVEAEYGMLVAELAGLMAMSAQRIQALQAVCTAEKC
jgi:hypothetical protein